MLIARAETISASTRLAADSSNISIFAQRLSGIVSVGLKAVAFVPAFAFVLLLVLIAAG
jgi:hypothetical protein